MPAGATDANGVYQYGSSDTQPTFHGLLNVGGGVLSTTIAAINTRIAQQGVATFATLALLLASTGHAIGYLAKVINMPGALFVATSSSAGAWQMHGTPRFATAAARTSAVTTPVAGMRSRRADYWCDEEYDGSTWVPVSPRIVPSSATNGAVSSRGVITSTAQPLVRIRDAFPPGFRVFRCVLDVTMSAATGFAIRLAVDATDATTAYDRQQGRDYSTTRDALQPLNGNAWEPGPYGTAGSRHLTEFTIVDPNVAGPTLYLGQTFTTIPTALTTSTGLSTVGGLHRTATAYNSLLIFGGSGNVTVNFASIEGVA